MFRTGALLAAFVLSAAPVLAQPPDPTDLARGLREAGMPDLAVEYLDEVAARKPSAAALAVIPLEKARALLDLADGESDDGRRASLVAEAKAGFEQFLAANPNHARRAEATIMLARVVSVEAKGILSRAAKIDGATEDAAVARKAEKAKARPVFQDASKRFGQAAAEFAKKLDDAALTPAQKKNLTRDVYQAELDRGINAFLLADTYDRSAMATVKDKQDRAAALDQAAQYFNALYNRDATHPLAWVARAWAAECEREKDSLGAATKINDEIKAAARKTGAVALGLRTANFFELRQEYVEAVGEKAPAKLRKVQTGLEFWLADPLAKSARPAPEVFAARFYLGFVKQTLAATQVKVDKDGKLVSVPAAARELLQSAEKDFKRLTETENDYAGRAAEKRTQVIRWLIGDAEKSPAAITNFEECLMTAQVQLYRALKDEKLTEPDRVVAMNRAVALYERARQLPVPKELTRDAADAQANLVYTYIMAERPHQAAVLGEYLAHNARPTSVAARAGLYGIQAYLTAASKVEAADAAGRKVDQDRAVKLALFLDKQYPTDVSTDAVRVVVGQQLLRDGKPLDAFELLSRVKPGSPRGQAARLIEASAAYEILRSLPQAGGGAPVPADKKAEVYTRAIADLAAVPDQPAGAPAHDAKLSVLLSIQAAELHLTNKPAGYPLAEKAASLAADKANLYSALSAEEKKELLFKAEHARLRAVYAQAFLMYQQGRYADTMTKLTPSLAAMAQSGPAVTAAGPKKEEQEPPSAQAARRLDEFRRNEVIVLALQCRIKEGAVKEAGELFDMLKRFGGSLEASVSAMSKLLDTVEPQIAALRKQGKTKDADDLARGVGTLLDRIANEPNVSPAVLVFLGRGLREIGNTDKAVEFLNKVPAPAEGLDKPLGELDDAKRLPVVRYRNARLELARSYRQAKKFADADKVLADALGTKDKKGWGANDLNFRKEHALLLEAKGADQADPKAAFPLWRDANAEWGQMGREYQAILSKPLPKDEKARNDMERLRSQVKPIYFELFFEQTRCATKANLQLLKAKPAEIPAKLAGTARVMVELEKKNPDLPAEVKAKFADLMDEVPALKAEYQKLDGPKGLLRQAAAASN